MHLSFFVSFFFIIVSIYLSYSSRPFFFQSSPAILAADFLNLYLFIRRQVENNKT